MEIDVRFEILNSEVTYASLRAGFMITLDCLLRDSLNQSESANGPFGFLDRIPRLAGTAPQIQLECLLTTWNALQDESRVILSPMDRFVCMAATELLAQLCAENNQRILHMVWQGPRTLATNPDFWLYSKIRCFQAGQDWSAIIYPTVADENAHDFGQIQDLPGLSGENDELLNTVGRWRADGAVLLNSGGLLNVTEQDIVRTFFEEHPELLG